MSTRITDLREADPYDVELEIAEKIGLIPQLGERLCWDRAGYLAMSDKMDEEGFQAVAVWFRWIADHFGEVKSDAKVHADR